MSEASSGVVCSQLCVSRGGRRVLHDIDLHLPTDACLTVIGPNGSGKTTLLQAMLGLLPPAAGSVAWNGRAATALSPRSRARLAAYAPQTNDELPAFRVEEVVATGRFAHTPAMQPLSTEDQRIIDETLKACGLQSLRGRRVTEVSGGERQKTLIAAAIAQDAEVLFLDEPTTALDPGYQIELVRLLRAWRDRGRGLVVVSHELNLPLALGERVIALRDGRIAADGPADEVVAPARLAEIYGAPFERMRTAEGRWTVTPAW